jgi:hypothetical protein
MSNELKKVDTQPSRFLVPANFQEAYQIAEMLSNSEMVPKNYQRKPNDIVIAMAMGAELGFQPLQSLQNIAVINGRPSVWGDAFRALIIGSPDLLSFKEWFDDSTQTAHCQIERRLASGTKAEFEGSFSLEDAKQAGLFGKQGPWTQYTKRMQQWRALGFAGRNAYADRLRGIWIDAEAQDLPEEKDVTPAESKSGSLLNKAMNKAKSEPEPETETATEPEVRTGPSKFEILEMSFHDCTCVEELNEVADEVGKAVNAKQISQSERDQLSKIYRRLRHSFENVDQETGEIA